MLSRNSSVALYIIAGLLLLPALLVNLGLMPLIEDEAIRALVALEMKLSGNYLTPTIGGELYLKKPPLYNWIVCVFFALTNNYSEFIIRLPTIISLVLFSITIFLFVKREFGYRLALLCSFALITSGRILLYESQKGLIDMLFSMVIYINFQVIYLISKREKQILLYLISCFLCATGYMLKGLPAVVFQGITFIVLVVYMRRIRVLFSVRHFAGIFLFFLATGTYYLLYALHNDIPLKEVFSVLMSESTRRTVMGHGWTRTLTHLFVFPFNFIYWFLPWTILLLSLFQKGVIAKILQSGYLKYTSLIFIANILVYWTSPEIYGRYLIMFVPLLYIICFYGYNLLPDNSVIKKVIDFTFIISAVLLIVVTSGIFFHPVVSMVRHGGIKTLLLLVALSALVFLLIKSREHIFPAFIIIMLIIRMGFDWFVLPYRISEPQNNSIRNSVKKVSKSTTDKPLYTYWPPYAQPDPYYGKRVANYSTMYYITSERQEILESRSEITPTTYYLTRPCDLDTSTLYLKIIIEADKNSIPYHLVYVSPMYNKQLASFGK